MKDYWVNKSFFGEKPEAKILENKFKQVLIEK